jgi:brassinosteroid-6-oxidase 1
MALLLAVLGVVLGLVVASSLLLLWNKVRYSRRRGLPPGTMGWPLFGETTEFLKQGPSFMKSRRLRLVGKPARHGISHLHACSFPVSQRKTSACACSVYVPSFSQMKKREETHAGWLVHDS